MDGKNSDYALIENGLDNLAFNKQDELFVSSYSEGYVLKVSENTIEPILPGGISHAGGIAIIGNDIVVADIQSVKLITLRMDQNHGTTKTLSSIANGSKHICINL